ncbi:MAG: response regulator transcription factor, partial [Bacteroidota bacterium]
MDRISVVVADSNKLISEGLKLILSQENDITLTGEAESEDSLMELLSEKRVDIVMLDFTARNFRLETISTVLHQFPEVQIVAITYEQEGETIVNALKSGVKSYVKKDCHLDEIVSSVRDTAQGNRFFCTQILRAIDADHIDPNSDEFESFACDPIKLSEREQEIITLIAEGFTNTEIAEKLFLSPHTVNTHRKNIMQKLGVKNTASIVMYAVKANLVNVNKFLFS